MIDYLINKLYALKRFLRKDWNRAFRLYSQRLTQGFPDSDTWNLDYHIAEYSLPRLRRFKEVNNGYPGDLTPEKWDEMLDDMIYSMDVIVNRDSFDDDVDDERVHRGLKLFGQRFRHLWW